MRSLAHRRTLLLTLTTVLALAAAACGTLENEVHITYRTPTQTVTKMTMRGGGPMEDILLSGGLRDILSRADWNVESDDGGDGPATLTATFEGDSGNPFPAGGATRGPNANPGQALFRNVETSVEESLFTRRLTVKFTNEPGMLGTPALPDQQSQQALEVLLAAVGIQQQGSGARQPELPEGLPAFDRSSFDMMLDAVLKLRVAVTMPGRIVVTDGTTSGSTVTWQLNAAALREAREHYVVSEEFLWQKVGAAAAAGLMFVAAFALLAAYLVGQRNARRAVPAPAAGPAAPPVEEDTTYMEQFRPQPRTDETGRGQMPDAETDNTQGERR